MILTHFRKLRRPTSRYRQCFIQVYIEANLSQISADDCAKLVHRDLRCGDPRLIKFVSRDHTKEHRIGVWTDNPAKEAYAGALRHNIYALFVAEEYESQTLENTTEDCIQALYRQLRDFRVEFIEKPDGTCLRRHTGKGAGRKDDIAMAIMIFLYYALKDACQNYEFQLFCRQNSLLLD